MSQQQDWMAEEASNSDKYVIDVAGAAPFDITPFVKSVNAIVAAQKQMIRNPYDRRALSAVGMAGLTMRRFEKTEMPASVGAVLRPVIRQMTGPMVEAARTAIQLRMHAEHKLVMHPTQVIPLTLNAVANNAIATATIQNPYQGSGATLQFMNTLWAITAFESGPLVYTGTATGALLVRQALFAGHDYVAASLGGIVTGSTTAIFTAVGTAGVAGAGWPWYIFASDKRERPHTTFSPWNLQGAAGIIGAVMRETGQVTLSFQNLTGATITGITFSVHVKASLCGSPFGAATENLHKMFVPFNLQMKAAHRLANFRPMALRAISNQISQNMPMPAPTRGFWDVDGMDELTESVLASEMFEPG